MKSLPGSVAEYSDWLDTSSAALAGSLIITPLRKNGARALHGPVKGRNVDASQTE
jgi:hypothetical protein